MFFRKKFLFIFLFIICAFHSYSQKQTNFWFFGTLAGIDFNSGSPVALPNGALNTTEGCSAASDASGNLLFYTDGVSVWDKTNTQMPNGNGLAGDPSSTQSALVVPVPGSTTLYYIFTVDYVVGPKGFEYSIVDMTLNSGKGDVTTKNTLIKSNVTEKLCAVYHCDGQDIWVMVHEWNSNRFFAYLVTAAGISAPVISSVGILHNGNSTNNSIGQMKFSNDGSKIACAIGYKDSVNVCSFSNNSGAVSNPIALALGNHVYGVEFSPDNSKFYTSYYQIGNAGWVSQFDLTAANIPASQTVLGTSFDPNYFYSLQIASDGKIYASTDVSSFLGVVNSPNIAGAGCNFVVQGFNVDPTAMGHQSMLGLPGFVASYFFAGFPNIPACSKVVANFSGSDTVLCKNQCISFTDMSTGTPAPNNWQWIFTGAAPDTSTFQNPSNICYSTAGNYSVTLIASNANASDTIIKTIIVMPGPTANAGADTIITLGTSATLNASGGGNYVWSPSTGLSCTTCPDPAANPSLTTTYFVTVTDTNGCSATDSVTVKVVTDTHCDSTGAFYFPNAFSPNGDGDNDSLKVYYTNYDCIKTLHLSIYDRFGELVFETTDPLFLWNGTYKNKMLNTQPLAYHLSVEFKDKTSVERKGTVNLVR